MFFKNYSGLTLLFKKGLLLFTNLILNGFFFSNDNFSFYRSFYLYLEYKNTFILLILLLHDIYNLLYLFKRLLIKQILL